MAKKSFNFEEEEEVEKFEEEVPFEEVQETPVIEEVVIEKKLPISKKIGIVKAIRPDFIYVEDEKSNLIKIEKAGKEHLNKGDIIEL